MSGLRHAIFDFDGTLVDSLPGIHWSIERALADCGLPPFTASLRPLIGPPIRDILSNVSGLGEGPSLNRLEQAFRRFYDAEGWRQTACYRGVNELLGELAANHISLWMVTNKPEVATRKIANHLNLSGFFEEIVCRDSRLPEWGSKAEGLMDLMCRRGLAPHECVLVGDTAEDQSAASAAGMACVIVPHGYGPLPSSPIPAWDAVRERLSQGSVLAEVSL